MGNKLKYLVIHCTYTPAFREITKEDIERWHIKENGWSRVGYNDMIHLDGSLENLIECDQDDTVDQWEIANGVRGFNGISRHVVYVGGKGGDTRTNDQYRTLAVYCHYTVLRHSHIKIIGHNQVSNKSCPSFDVPTFLRKISISEKNIGL